LNLILIATPRKFRIPKDIGGKTALGKHSRCNKELLNDSLYLYGDPVKEDYLV